jgi:quinol monooxygenase YgiN
MLAVTGRLIAAKGKEKELENILKPLPAIVQKKEKSTLLYIFHRSKTNPREFLFYEQYPDKKTFEAHLAQPYIKEAFEKFTKVIEGEVQINEYDVVVGDTGKRS